ncbi:hypothetical protein [Streptomyces sp. NPDC093094]|uniref:hypothetical protein n=1 Tax=Streptomyces sp. NPDC093094 TaxID=3366026 RepID=UPI00380B817C
MTDSTSDTSDTTGTSGLASHYIAQVTDDLERNIKEQDRLTAEIAALEARLAGLRQDHTVLVAMRQALGAAVPAVPAADTSVPAPREEAAVRPRRTRKTAPARAGKAPAARRTTAAPEAAPAGEATGTAPARPTLVELVRAHLAAQNEPRSAAEVTTALGAAHPGRGIKANVVRTTLEGLVARNGARRSKQGTSVFYSAPDPETAG